MRITYDTQSTYNLTELDMPRDRKPKIPSCILEHTSAIRIDLNRGPCRIYLQSPNTEQSLKVIRDDDNEGLYFVYCDDLFLGELHNLSDFLNVHFTRLAKPEKAEHKRHTVQSVPTVYIPVEDHVHEIDRMYSPLSYCLRELRHLFYNYIPGDERSQSLIQALFEQVRRHKERQLRKRKARWSI